MIKGAVKRLIGLKSKPKETLNTQLKLAIAAERAENFKRATDIFSSLRQAYPDNSKMLDTAGRFYYRRGDLPNAISALRQALSSSDNKIGCRATLAAALKRNDELDAYQALMDEMENTEHLRPGERMVLAEYLAQRVDRRADAKHHFDQALNEADNPGKLNERHGRFLIRVALLEKRAGKDLKYAVNLYQEGLNLVADPAPYQQNYDDLAALYFQETGETIPEFTPIPAVASTEFELPSPVFKVDTSISTNEMLKLANAATKDPERFDEARAFYEYVFEQGEDNPKARQSYAEIMSRIAQQMLADGNEPGAVACYERAIESGPQSYRAHIRYAGYLVKAEKYDRAEEILRVCERVATKEVAHYFLLGNTMTRLSKNVEARKYFQLALEQDKTKTVGAHTRLADVESALGNFHEAIKHYEALNAISGDDRANANNNRRIHLLNLRDHNFNAQDKERLDVCQTFYQKNTPKLDQEQQRVLDELVDRGISMTDFDSLFGKSHQDLWDRAEAHVKSFTEDPDVRALEKRISECDDFNADPEFAKSFKPSIVNYRLLKGEMYATEAAYQFYLNKRILDIANSYNEMVSKIRNVALWLTPPIGGKNVGERKGSQIWHRDQEDENILKCFIYYTDVEEGCGPTEYIPYSKVKPERKYSNVLGYPSSSGYPGAYLIDKLVDPADMMAAKGKKKSIMFFDTNGFHRGGYVTESRRILTMATFLRPVTPYADTNTKLSMKDFDADAYPFEASYGIAP